MRMKLDHYLPPKQTNWSGRDDGIVNERIFQKISLIDLCEAIPITAIRPNPMAIVGFCSDTGIKRNKGRLGARQGPQAFRKYFGNLALLHNSSFYDLGDIHCDDDNLARSQEELGFIVSWALTKNMLLLIVGGGHELSFGGFQGVAQVIGDNVGIINFDAHFDLRPLKEKEGNSGTSFWQIARSCAESNRLFDYLILGLEPASNTASLFSTASELKASWLTAEDIHFRQSDCALKLNKFIARQKYIYLSICLDVFAQAFAPGVSAPQPLGLYPAEALLLLKCIMASQKVLCIDIAELSPPLDESDKTARLCAFLAHAIFQMR